jgi:hypothetical protein
MQVGVRGAGNREADLVAEDHPCTSLGGAPLDLVPLVHRFLLIFPTS